MLIAKNGQAIVAIFGHNDHNSCYGSTNYCKKVRHLWVSMENMVKMQITGENGLEKDGSYEKLQSKQKNRRKKGNFWAISFVKLVES